MGSQQIDVLVDVLQKRGLPVMGGSLKTFLQTFSRSSLKTFLQTFSRASLKAFLQTFFFFLLMVKHFAPVGRSPMIALLYLHGGGHVDLSVWVKELQLLF